MRQQLIDKNPKDFEAYNALALALARRARETSDPNFYTQGEQALQKSFAISPGNYDGARIQVWLLLGKHEFAAALEAATKLNKRVPDDVMVYGFLTDSNVELGNYSASRKCRAVDAESPSRQFARAHARGVFAGTVWRPRRRDGIDEDGA